MLAFIKNKLNVVLLDLGWEDLDYSLWFSKDIEYGHLNSNLVIVIAQRYHLSSDFVSKKLMQEFAKITIFNKFFYKKPFCYFFLKQEIFTEIINKALEEKVNFGKVNLGRNQKLNYEWVSANPTGYLHFGHARNIFVGQTIANLLEFVGYDVTREFYINDYGNQVYQLGKTVFYYYQKFLKLNPQPFTEMYKNSEVKPLGALAFAEFKDIYKNAVFDQNKLVQKKFINFATDFFLKIMKKDLKLWGLAFDVWFSEKSLYESGYYQKFLQKLEKKKLSYKKDGALWFDTSQTDYEQDFVLVKKDGSPAYFLGDIMYHDNKLQRQFKLVIDVFGADHHSHFLKIVTGLKSLGWNSQNVKVDLLQMVKVVRHNQVLKISKRQGTAVSIHHLVKKIGLNFLKFLLISKKKETALIFNFDYLNKASPHPFFYIQYSYVRCYQLLQKLTNFKIKNFISGYSLLTNEAEQNLILNLQHFPFLIIKTVKEREPQLLVDFLMKLARNFHHFYQNNSITNASSVALKEQRLALVQAVYQVFTNISKIIGLTLSKKKKG